MSSKYKLINISKEISNECKKYNIKFIDTSFDLNEKIDEILNEICIVSSSNYNIRIRIHPSDSYSVGFLPDPYFKVYNNTSEPRATAVARISILRPEYVKHTDGLETFVLGKKEIGFIIKSFEYSKRRK